MQPPQLLYHADSPTLYPTNTQSSLITVRFPSAVHISSIRIAPEGVLTPTGTGTTFPAQWVGEVFMNASDALPVNALERRNITFNGGEWPVEFDIGMPEDVTTRLIALLAPVQSITLSIYGYHAAGPSMPAPSVPTLETSSKEDFEWVSAWAGGVGGLIDVLESRADTAVKERALDCLNLLEERTGIIIPQLPGRAMALAYVLQSAHTTLADRIFDHPDYAQHPAVKKAIRTSHPLYGVLHLSGQRQREAAWKHLDSWLSLHVLMQGDGADLMGVEAGMARSNLSRLMEVAERLAAGQGKPGQRRAEKLELILDILSSLHIDQIALLYLANNLPRLTAICNTLSGSQRTIDLPTAFAPAIARSLLLCSTLNVDGKSVLPATQLILRPYIKFLPSDSPYHMLFSPAPPILPPITDSATADSRRLSRLLHSLAFPAASSICHTATPAELVHILAPDLYNLLSTAPIPLLDIPSALANPTPESQASAWAGKVYTSNEFREREEARVGLGIKGAKTGLLAQQGTGPGQSSGASLGNEGLQPGQARISRPASRHVDDFGT